jgi:hypothetical protein
MSVGMFNNKSYYGYKSSILKSGICKYYRRKQFDKFEWCVMEMMLFGLKSKGLLTNVLNRMKILLMEEIICVEGGRLYECIMLLESIGVSELEMKMSKMLEICDIVRGCKRGRVVSYMNNWWKYKATDYNLDSIELNAILKYKKNGDGDELLKYGELFIRFVKDRNEDMVGVLNKVYNMKGGLRYRRKDAVYLLISIIEAEFAGNAKFQKIIEFGRNMIYRTGMKERMAFCVWVVLLVLKYDSIDFNEFEWVKPDIGEYLETRTKITINEDYVVNDWHVNKKNSKEKFGKVGAFVEGEDLSILEDGIKYREFYIEKKKTVAEEPIEKKKKKKLVLAKEQFIDWSDFKEIKVLEEGVCGFKVCCIRATYEGKKIILKEMRESFNYGRDYWFMDSVKPIFGINSLNMKLIRSNMGLQAIDKTIRSFIKNWQFSEREVVYSMMDDFDNIGDIGKNKDLLENDAIYKECLKIRLYDGLFRSSDNIMRNILVNSDGEVMSIDENDIYGKRKLVFGKKNDYYVNKNNIAKCKIVSMEIIDEWDLESKIPIISKMMTLYKFGDMIEEMRTRFMNYKDILLEEL